MVMKVYCFLIPILLLCSCSPQDIKYPCYVSEWISTSPPEYGTDAWYSANYSAHEWNVYLHAGKVCTRLLPPKRNIIGDQPDFVIPDSRNSWGQKYTLKVNDGWLIGYNAGEWGGSLWWFSNTGKAKYKISNAIIKGYIQKDGTIYALEGLDHLGVSEGSIMQVVMNTDTGRYESKVFTSLKETPYAAIFDKNDSMVVVTSSNLISIDRDAKINKLVRADFWRGLYPNSIVIDEQDAAYIGMRQGVAKVLLTESNPKIEWLIPH